MERRGNRIRTLFCSSENARSNCLTFSSISAEMVLCRALSSCPVCWWLPVRVGIGEGETDSIGMAELLVRSGAGDRGGGAEELIADRRASSVPHHLQGALSGEGRGGCRCQGVWSLGLCLAAGLWVAPCRPLPHHTGGCDERG